MSVSIKNWFNAFSVCSVIEMYLERVGLDRRKANIISCILFQSYFVFIGFKLLLLEWILRDPTKNSVIKQATLQNIDDIYGYFVFDTIYLITENPNTLFIGHHITSFFIISIIRSYIADLSENTPFYLYNCICILAEIQNPILNLRHLTRGYPELKELNKQALYWSYLIFRITLFPIFSASFLYYNQNIPYFYPLTVLFILLYSVSVMWFQQIRGMTIHTILRTEI